MITNFTSTAALHCTHIHDDRDGFADKLGLGSQFEWASSACLSLFELAGGKQRVLVMGKQRGFVVCCRSVLKIETNGKQLSKNG